MKHQLSLLQQPQSAIDTPVSKKKELIVRAIQNYTTANKVELICSNETTPHAADDVRRRSCLKAAAQSYFFGRSSRCCQKPTATTLLSSNSSSSLRDQYHLIESPGSSSSSSTLADSRSSSGGLFITMSQNKANAYSSLIDPNKIHLFVKAGQDGRSQGACPFCQDVFIQLLIKAQTNKFNFDVITINLDNPPKEFKELSIKPPVLIHGHTSLLNEIEAIENGSAATEASAEDTSSDAKAIILSDIDEIAEYLDRLYPNSALMVQNPEATKVCMNVFSKFSYFIRDVASKPTSLEAELEKLDTYLKENVDDEQPQRHYKFLNGDTMTALDCSLLPKLQHIRVAGESIKKFKIPHRLGYLWKYLKNAYESDAFQKSCPPDREIIWHWSKSNIRNKELLQIMHDLPYKTLTLPEDLHL